VLIQQIQLFGGRNSIVDTFARSGDLLLNARVLTVDQCISATRIYFHRKSFPPSYTCTTQSLSTPFDCRVLDIAVSVFSLHSEVLCIVVGQIILREWCARISETAPAVKAGAFYVSRWLLRHLYLATARLGLHCRPTCRPVYWARSSLQSIFCRGHR